MSAPRPLPDGLLLAFYGDDFTGSSSATEVFAFAGIETVLFLGTPTPERIADFAGVRAIGIAGIARARSPEWMDRELPPIFRLIASLGAPVTQYKACSTFDSAPGIGSIGRAIDLADPILNPDRGWIPMVIGDPGMGRFQSFGHLFALLGEAGYRLDRHPTMSRHPVTPMDEADLARHLGRQTAKPVGLVDFVAMKRGQGSARLATARAAGAEIVSLDVMDQETLAETGRLIWEEGGPRVLSIASQGLQGALVAYWRDAGLIPRTAPPGPPAPVERIACVSGSVSPNTAQQIAFALDHGFADIAIDATRTVDAAAWESETGRAADAALAALGQGRDPLVYSAAGPDDPAVARLRDATATSGVSAETVNDRIGAGLGAVMARVLAAARLPRAVISGGDTSGHAATLLGIDALTAIAPLAPGAPLCRAHAPASHGPQASLDGLEIVLKGGQVGRPDFFLAAKGQAR